MLETVKSLLLQEYSPEQWLLAFFLYSFAGWCWEVALSLVKHHRFVNRGFLTGPILPIYGFGAMIILIVCVPVQNSVLLVALLGAAAATLLELATGAAMESLFHVRYWDYTQEPLNLHGYICAKATIMWALFSALLMRMVNPLAHDLIAMIPTGFSMVLSGSFSAFALADTFAATRRALDLRKLLESMERYATELEALHGGLDSVGERVGDMIRAFGHSIEAGEDELAQKLQQLSAVRERVAQQAQERRISVEEAAKERFAAFEHALTEIADLVPDTTSLREEIRSLREKYENQAEALHDARLRRLAHARAVLRRNPSAISKRHGELLARLREEEETTRGNR